MIRPDTWSITKSKIFPLKVADKEYINIWINQCKYQGSINGCSLLLYFYSSESQPAKTSTNRNTP